MFGKKEKKAPNNTTRDTLDNPIGFLAESAVVGTGNAIEAQEARGQDSFVNSTTLPSDIRDAKAILQEAGVQFGEAVEDDPMFLYAELPDGWKKEATDHSMWSNLVDEKGRTRATMFYKAAFYDRSAHLSLSRRYNYRRDYDREDSEGVAVSEVTDCGKVIHTTEPIPLPEDRKERYEVGDKANEAAQAWLGENYPEWKNPGAYWD